MNYIKQGKQLTHKFSGTKDPFTVKSERSDTLISAEVNIPAGGDAEVFFLNKSLGKGYKPYRVDVSVDGNAV